MRSPRYPQHTKRCFYYLINSHCFVFVCYRGIRDVSYVSIARNHTSQGNAVILLTVRDVRLQVFRTEYQVWFPSCHYETCTTEKQEPVIVILFISYIISILSYYSQLLFILFIYCVLPFVFVSPQLKHGSRRVARIAKSLRWSVKQLLKCPYKELRNLSLCVVDMSLCTLTALYSRRPKTQCSFPLSRAFYFHKAPLQVLSQTILKSKLRSKSKKLEPLRLSCTTVKKKIELRIETYFQFNLPWLENPLSRAVIFCPPLGSLGFFKYRL